MYHMDLKTLANYQPEDLTFNMKRKDGYTFFW
jgi:hypothetical protein